MSVPMPKLSHELYEMYTAMSAQNHERLVQAYAKSYARGVAAKGKEVPAVPIDMILYCPACGTQHIDATEFEHRTDLAGTLDVAWTNPPHRSHLCAGCGHIWRPADVPTNGVATIATKGKADSAPASTERNRSQYVLGVKPSDFAQQVAAIKIS